MNKKTLDILLSIFCFIFGIYVCFTSIDVNFYEKLFPYIIGIGLIISGLVILFSALKNNYKKEEDNNDYRLVFTMITVLIVYAVIIEHLGYIISTIALVSIILYLLKNRSIKRILIISCATVFVVYVLFSIVLNVPLPSLM